jgi:hypothetical protein
MKNRYQSWSTALNALRTSVQPVFLRNRKYAIKSRRELDAAARAAAFNSAACVTGPITAARDSPEGHFPSAFCTTSSPINHLQKKKKTATKYIPARVFPLIPKSPMNLPKIKTSQISNLKPEIFTFQNRPGRRNSAKSL